MKQIFHNFILWEDYKNGMYACSWTNEEEVLHIQNAVKILSNADLFSSVLINVLNDWKISADVNLSNQSQNRRAWLGWAACSYKYKVPEILTRVACNTLTEQQQITANKVAENFIKKYETKNEQIIIEFNSI